MSHRRAKKIRKEMKKRFNNITKPFYRFVKKNWKKVEATISKS